MVGKERDTFLVIGVPLKTDPLLSLRKKAAVPCLFRQKNEEEKTKKDKVAPAATTAVTARGGDLEISKWDE